MAVCPPLSAIETPRISDHEGNHANNQAPKYSFGPVSETLPATILSSDPGSKDISSTKSSIIHGDHFKGTYVLCLPAFFEWYTHYKE